MNSPGYHETRILGADHFSRSLASATWHARLADDRHRAHVIPPALSR
jgi:hypothetical protein